MIKLENINKSFGGYELFTDLSFSVNKGEKVGLVGRNGHGKTTLFRIITGEISQDKGEVVIPKNYKIGYLKQHLDFKENTILKEAITGLPKEQRYEDWKAKKILMGLGFTEEDFDKSPMVFSGGYQLRINLAKVLLSKPDLLLLDEPNNYLDIVAIRWLENFLRAWQGEILLITHDRDFMDSIVSHTVCIHRKKAKKIEGNTSKLYSQIEQEEEIHEKTRQNAEKKRKQTEIFITKFRAKARLGGLVQSRVKQLEKQEIQEKLERIEKLEFRFNYAEFNASQMMLARNLSFGYEPNKEIIKDFSLNIDKQDKIAIIGKNGKGKSTLLKLLYGELKSKTGEIRKHDNLKQGYFGQTNVNTLINERSVLEELLSADPLSSIQNSRNVAGNLMFSGDDALKKIKVLSGGEKSRVTLGKILLSSHNLLFLDEPTNHLDMDSCEAFLEAVIGFEGAVLMVTHNEEYLRKFAERLIVFDNDEIRVFDGTYDEFLEKFGWVDERELNDKKNIKKKVDKKEARKERAKILEEKNKRLAEVKSNIEKLEKEILELEENIERLCKDLIVEPSNKDFAIALKNAKDEVEKKYDDIAGLYVIREEIAREYEI